MSKQLQEVLEKHLTARKKETLKALEKAELRTIRFHDLRHTYASLRVAKGDNLQDVSKQLGHHSVKFTLDVYYHWMPGGSKCEIDELDSKEAPDRTPGAPDAEIDQKKKVSNDC